MADEDEGFLSRWSKRKTDIRSGKSEEVEQQTASLAPELDPHVDTDGNETTSVISDDDIQPEMLEESDFEDVDFDELDKSSDYTRFIKANVPAAIQKRALRKLWASDSVFEVLDGMNDYDEDFTGDGLAGKIFKTAHKVGRGFMTDEDDVPAEDEEDALAEEESSADPQTVEIVEEADKNNEDNLDDVADVEATAQDNKDVLAG